MTLAVWVMLDTETHAAFVGDRIEPFEDFPYDQLDQPPADPPEALASDALARILGWCWSDGDANFQLAFRRFCVLSRAVNPQWVGRSNYRELGDRIGCSRALMSKYLRSLCKEFEVHLGQRSDTSRLRMRQARLQQRGADGKVIARRKSPPAVTEGL